VIRTVLIYSLVIAGAAFVLQWLEYQYAVRKFSTEIYVVIIAVGFAALGLWVGHHLSGGRKNTPFEPNQQAIDYLGLSRSEQRVLGLLADGMSNAEIAKRLHVTVNTVKSHLKSLYQKLEVARRTQAVNKARSLKIIE